MAEFGFPNDTRYRFRINNQLFRVNPDGAEVLAILTEIYNASVSCENACWALRMRHCIRRIELLDARSVLTLVIQKTPDDRVRVLAIWLRGRCGGHIGTSVVAKYAYSPNLRMQKEAVRALRRMSGWSQLRAIANSATSSRIRTMATQRAGRPLDDRLSSVLTNIRPIPIPPRRNEIWILPGLRLSFTPPKAVEHIRRVLMRIKRLASGPRS